MKKIDRYEILESVAETRKSLLYRGRAGDSAETVIIKVLKTRNPTPSEIARFRQEYRLIKSLDLEGVVKVKDFLEQKEGFALVLEDFEGHSVKSLLEEKKRFDARSFLPVAIRVADALRAIHEREIVHRDIKPSNILMNPRTGAVKITDFGISTELTRGNEDIYNQEVIAGSLAYMSPEQTGRMNRTVDYRTDFYSLGVAFYEMLAGRLPFHFDDPMAVIHGHIAVMPPPPREHHEDIPGTISAIVMKLLSKNAEDRYQNGLGLVADLKQCLAQLDKTGEIKPFQLGMQDISKRFLIPPKLYGREKEIETLLSGFEKLYQTNGAVEIMLVSGYSGIGKSALINEIHKPIVARRGYFISGKYEQFRRDKPYSAVIQAFQGLVRQILVESDERIDIWRQNLLQALGPNGRVITDIIPEVELVIGPQPELGELGPEETRNRFKYVFEKFACAFPTEQHPVALFLDDLQWADIPSLQLIQNMTNSADMAYLYLIGSYRDNEVDETHPLNDAVREIEKAQVAVDRIELKPILQSDVQDLIVNFLKCSQEQGAELAALMHKKTGGNPFFVIQFMETLYNEKLIRPDGAKGWQWDRESIDQLQVTDNVVDLMASKIDKQAKKVRELLQICAAVGNRFDLEILSYMLERPIDDVLDSLKEAIDVGFIGLLPEKDLYSFHHDRIQEAAYSLVPDGDRAALHQRIGKKALENVQDEEELDKKLFYIVDQLNFGSGLIAEEKEREQLARLNLKAGIKAKASSAFLPAVRYLEMGIELLRQDCWEKQYDLALALYTEITEAAYLIGDFQRMNQLAEEALAHAVTTLDKVKITISRVNARRSEEDFHGSIEEALPILRLLGIRMSKNTTKARVAVELLGVKLRLLGRPLDRLLELPDMTDPTAVATMQVLADLGLTSFFVNPNLLALDIIKAFGLSMKRGNSPDTVFAYAGFGVVLVGGLWDYRTAVEHGKLGLKLMDKLGVRKQMAKTLLVNNVIINHWRYPLKQTIPSLLDGYRVGLETGDTNFASFCLHMSDIHAYFVGRDLSELDVDLDKHIQVVKGLNQKYITTLLQLKRQNVHSLLGKSDDPLLMTGEAIRAEELEPEWIKANNSLALAVFYFVRAIARFVYNEYSQVLQDVKGFHKYKESMQGVLVNRYVNFYDSLSRLVLYPDLSFFKRIGSRLRVAFNQLVMKYWVRNAPENCLHQYHLVEAMRSWRIGNNPKRARKHFDRTLELCKRPDDVIVESACNELMATMYRSTGDESRADEQLSAAYNAYASWGALGKLEQLRKKYPQLVEATGRARAGEALLVTDTTTTGAISQALDISSAMKASQAISGEILLEKLLVKMIDIAMKNAGADRGVMLLEDQGKLLVEAEKSSNGGEVQALQSIPVESHQGVSPAIASYVARTREMLILNDAVNEGAFTRDPYVEQKQPKSVLCLPIIGQGRLLGLLYLENNLTVDAFTPERLELLRIISSQAAISIENARLLVHREKAAVLEKEMEIAATIQTSLLPESPAVSDYEIAAYMQPADEVGGDYYDVFSIGGTDWIVIGDVSGHGVPAGLIMMMTQTAIHSVLTARPELSPAELLTAVNRVIANNIKRLGEDKYMTITALACRANGEFRFAGLHQDILIYRESSKKVEPVETDGVWVGLMEDVEGMLAESSLMLERGDAMLLYTDGITEARKQPVDGGAKQQMYGDENLVELLGEVGGGTAEQIKQGILRSLEDYERPDDVTLVVVRRRPR